MAAVLNIDGAALDAPSRHDNPFATCWTRPGAMTFQFGEGQSIETLVEKLAAQRWHGAIIGPHGCGKSTLLEMLKPVLEGNGWQVHAITLQNGQRQLPPQFWSSILPAESAGRRIVVIDGYEQLGRLERMWLSRRCRRAKCGLLVTAHQPVRIPLLVRLSPNVQLAQRLVAELSSRVSTQVDAADVAASFARHGSNVREMFFELYDRHEQWRRSSVSAV
jgi:hypothetical protein